MQNSRTTIPPSELPIITYILGCMEVAIEELVLVVDVFGGAVEGVMFDVGKDSDSTSSSEIIVCSFDIVVGGDSSLSL